MKITTDRPTYNKALIERYRTRIPKDLWDILMPDGDRLADFAVAVKALRIKEEERDYVRDIQLRYRISLRPDESVKETMIRVRMAILKLRRSRDEDENLIDAGDSLPVDPLE